MLPESFHVLFPHVCGITLKECSLKICYSIFIRPTQNLCGMFPQGCSLKGRRSCQWVTWRLIPFTTVTIMHMYHKISTVNTELKVKQKQAGVEWVTGSMTDSVPHQNQRAQMYLEWGSSKFVFEAVCRLCHHLLGRGQIFSTSSIPL